MAQAGVLPRGTLRRNLEIRLPSEPYRYPRLPQAAATLCATADSEQTDLETMKRKMDFKIKNIVMKTMNFIKVLILTSLVVACGNTKKKNNVDESMQDLLGSANIEHSEKIGEIPSSGYFKIIGDSVEIPYFEVKLELSEKAEEKLKLDNESVIVMAWFTYYQKDKVYPEKYKDKVDLDSGELMLLSYRKELTSERLVKFENLKFPKDLYDLFGENKDINLLINIFSGRKSSEYNLLRCDILQDSMSKIKGKRFTLKGKLIYNDD